MKFRAKLSRNKRMESTRLELSNRMKISAPAVEILEMTSSNILTHHRVILSTAAQFAACNDVAVPGAGFKKKSTASHNGFFWYLLD